MLVAWGCSPSDRYSHARGLTMNDVDRLATIRGLIRGYWRKTERELYTDTGEAWDILSDCHLFASGETLHEWQERVGELVESSN